MMYVSCCHVYGMPNMSTKDKWNGDEKARIQSN